MKASVSMLREYLFCPRSVYLRHVLGLVPEKTEARIKEYVFHKAKKEFSLRESDALEKAGSAEELDAALAEEIEEILFDLPLLCSDYLAREETEPFMADAKKTLLSEADGSRDHLIYLIDEAGFEKCLAKVKPWRRNLLLDSDEFMLSGVVDKVVREKTYHPAEIKTCKAGEGLWECEKIEACAYSILLEASLGINHAIPYGYIEYSMSHERRPVMCTEKLREKVLETRDEVLKLLAEDIPEICPHGRGARCESCGYNEACYEI